MNRQELKELFDKQASTYDERWKKTAPIRDGLLFLLGSVFADLPVNARILCVGAGTGQEIVYLADRFPQWRFVAVEPSTATLEVCRGRADGEGFSYRCHFHAGYLGTLSEEHQAFDAATCFLVSQFILEPGARSEFFREIAARLRPGGILASSDLASDTSSAEFEALLSVWFNMMSNTCMATEEQQRIRTAFRKDVAVVSPAEVERILQAGGFEAPVRFYQAGLIHAWFSRSRPGPGA